MRRRHPFVIGYLLRRVGVRGGGGLVLFRDLGVLVYSPLETQLTHLPHLAIRQSGGHARARAVSLGVCADYKGGGLASSVLPPHGRVPGNLATINGAAVEHQFASTNG